MRIGVVLGAALLLAAGCGEIGAPDLGAIPATSTTTNDGAPTVTVDDGAVVETNPAVAQPSPPRPDGYVPTLVLSTDTGLLAGPPAAIEALAPPLDGVVALRSSDDFFGGSWSSGPLVRCSGTPLKAAKGN